MMFKKYVEEGRDKIQMIFDAIPAELNNKNKRFILSDLKKSARSERYESSFNLLHDAGVTLPCYNVQKIKQPLAINLSRNLFKCYMNDTGLLCAMSSSDVQFKILNDNMSISEGSIVENLYTTQLKSNGYLLYYYNRKKFGEINFIIEHEHSLIPIEIKSGKDYKKHLSLSKMIENENEAMGKPIVFCIGNVEETSSIPYLPLYMIMFLKHEHQFGIIDVKINI